MQIRVVAFAVAAVLSSATAAAYGSPLLDALEAGDRVTAFKLLEQGADAQTRGGDGTTSLMWAAYHQDADLTRRLIAAGVDVNAQNEFGASALSEAAVAANTSIVKALLDAGANANLENPDGEAPLMIAARTGNVEAAKLLLDAGADVNAKEEWGGQSALMWAAAQSQPEMIVLLLEHGADPNARGIVRQWERKVIAEPRPKDMNRGGFTPLLYAAREGCIECAQALIAGGANIDLEDPERVTPLNIAITNLHFDLAAALIDAGADVDKWDLFGRTPVYMAADVSTLPLQGNGAMSYIPSLDRLTAVDVLEKLLASGADPNIRLKRRPPYLNVPQDRGGDAILAQGATPLLRAARAGDAAAVKVLLAHGALVDLPSAYGVTPLMAAAGVEYGLRVTRGRIRDDAGVLATMELLVAAGANVNAAMVTEENAGTNYRGNTAQRRLDFSYNSRGRQVPGPAAVPHRTALHGAALKGFSPIVEFLARSGADLYAKDANGRTPLDLAMGRYEEDFLRQAAEPHVETVALLERLMAAQPQGQPQGADRTAAR
jgi:ankyrin repeat protein